jgi:hypothetical protein
MPQPDMPLLVDAARILEAWRCVGPLFLRIERKRRYAPAAAEVLRRLIEGDWVLWIIARDGAVVAALAASITAERDGSRTLRFEQCAAAPALQRPIDWPRAAETVKAWGRGRGAVRFTIEGRAGWRRLFPATRVVRVLMEGDLCTTYLERPATASSARAAGSRSTAADRARNT